MSEGNQKKSPLFEEFEKLRRETAGINSIIKNPSSGLVSQTTLNEILEVLGKMSEKQEELEKQIRENQLNINEKLARMEIVQQQSTDELSKKIEKLDQRPENSHQSTNPKPSSSNVPQHPKPPNNDEKIRVRIIDDNDTSRQFTTGVKKSDKIKILESQVIKNFGFKPSKYYLSLILGRGELNPESTFEENNVMNEEGIWCKK